jgi:peptide deformylase
MDRAWPVAWAPHTPDMYEDLQIILYPHPKLKRMSQPVDVFDQDLAALAQRMLELMKGARGVGLAAPQLGLNIRLFVVNATGQPGDDRVYVNPTLTDASGHEEGEEGCLSIPGLNVRIDRSKSIRIGAQDASGRAIDELATGHVARIWQHEFDHLNGTLLTDRMGPVARLANRKLLSDLEQRYAAAHPPPSLPAKAPLRRAKSRPTHRR